MTIQPLSAVLSYAEKADELSRDPDGKELSWWTGLAALLRTIAAQNAQLTARIEELEGSAKQTDAHLAWVSTYAEGMTENDWRDMRLLIIRDLRRARAALGKEAG